MTSKWKILPRLAALAMALSALSPAFAFDPPVGGDALAFLYSPVFLSGWMSVSSGDAPMAELLNPAASGGLQRTTLDASYTALLGLGAEQGWGSAINAGIAVPQNYGVWSGYVGFISSPFSSIPIGSVLTARVGLAKDVYPNLYLGMAVDFAVGSNDGLGWGLAADLGIQGLAGDVGFLKDLRWGLAIRNLGMPFETPSVPGMSGTVGANGYDSAYTPAIGVSADLLRSDKAGLTLAANVDFWFPTFQNLVFSTGMQIDWKDTVFLRFGWDFNLREAIAGADQGLLPSFGLGASFSVDRTTPEGGEAQPWDRSEIRPSLAAHQLYNDIWGFAAGINMPLGVIDRSPPKVNPGYPETAYISPNADGAKDELVLPIKIEDQRFVQGFALKIYDDKGELVRSIANKESRPESESFSGFWKRLVYVKKGVPVPEELVWNGLADSGQTVPDGTYTFVIEAEDDNGNQAVTERYTVVVDNTPPTVAATPSAGADTPIFSPDGDGNKDSLGINHVSSSEDLWTAEVVDATGTVIRTWEIKSADVGALAWDGKNEAGQIVPDGVYGYRVAAVDRAGNAGSAKVDNIIVNTQQPPVSVTIDLGAFSPNADGVKDALTLSPSVPVRTGLASWSLAVVDAAGKERWTVTGTGENSLEADYRFDGKDASGAALPEGTYRTQLVAKYVNGHTPTVWSPDFVIDLSPPTAKASSDRQAFNPLGDVRALVTISQSGSEEEAWQGQVLNAEGTAVKTWNFIGQPDQKLTWDGSDDAGATVPDGQYIYRLSAVDKAGNKTQVSTPAILVDTEKKAVRLALDRRAFSPNGDGTSDTVAIQPDVQSASRVRDWTLSIAGPDGNPVRVFKGTAAPSARVLWDGKTDAGQKAPDGGYLAVLEVRYTTDEVETARSVELTLDTVAPSITVSADDTLFSPNGDGRKDSLTIGQSSAAGDSWTGTVYNAAGKAVRVWSWRDQATALEWDGKDANGNVVPDGTYRYVVHSEDAAGNRAEKTVSGIGVDNRQVQVFVTAAAEGFSPNGDGVADTLSVSSIVNQKDGVASWRLAFVDASGAARKTLSGTAIASLPAKLTWDGKGDDGAVVQGQYTAVLTVDYRKGDRAEAKTAAFTLDSEGPRLSLSVGPRYFSPDNDGVDDELKVSLGVADLSALDTWRFDIYEVAVQEGSGDRKERLFFSWNGRGRPAERLTWDGRSQRGELVEAATDYVYRFSIQDAWGNKSVAEGVISVDVLVIRDGDRLKIKVPSIVFRPDFFDFKNLPADVVARNEEVLKRIAAILNRFKDYKIRVEGHANSVAKMTGAGQAAIDREEREVLDLSLNRAKAVMDKLIEYGVDARRLSVRGLGSSEPVVSFTDAENRWKNRRVEFILLKE